MAGTSRPYFRCPAIAEVAADVEAAPVADRRHRGRRLGIAPRAKIGRQARRGQRRRHHHRTHNPLHKKLPEDVSRHRAVCVACSSSPGARFTAKRVLRLGQPRRPL